MDRPKARDARSDDLPIAYQVHRSGDHDLLFSIGPFSNIGTMWESPEAHRLFERLGRFARVIRYDRRDSGLSDPIKHEFTLEAHGRELTFADRGEHALKGIPDRWALYASYRPLLLSDGMPREIHVTASRVKEPRASRLATADADLPSLSYGHLVGDSMGSATRA